MENISIRKTGEPRKIYLNDLLRVIDGENEIRITHGGSFFDGDYDEICREYQNKIYVVENAWFSKLYNRFVIECIEVK